jgi:hypothetical protein
VVTVQPRVIRLALAARPAGPGGDEVPLSIPRVPLNCPAVSIETRILSTLVWLRAQKRQVLVKFVAEQVSNIPAGKEVRLLQLNHEEEKLVPLLTSSSGKEVRLEQYFQACVKSVTQYGFTLVLQPYGG